MRFLLTTTQRCGSTWISQFLEAASGLECDYFDGTSRGFRLFQPSEQRAIDLLKEVVSHRPEIGVFKTHDIPSKDFDRVCEALPGWQIVTVNREFKDVVVSRYFYYRYHWAANPSLGVLAPHLVKLMESFRNLGDQDALGHLIASATLRNWAMEWAAFQGPFTTSRAVRLSYEGMLTGAEHGNLERVIRQPLPAIPSFADMQRRESAVKGRQGSQHFFREGRSGQWREWFSQSDGWKIDAMREEAEHDCMEASAAESARRPRTRKPSAVKRL